MNAMASVTFQDLSPLILPRSIVLVGASDKPDSIGARTLENLTVFSEWDGRLSLVNPGRSEIQGRPCLPTVRDLDHAPDVAILAVRADRVVDALQDCGELGVKFAIVFTSGFGETGGSGQEVEDRMREIVAATGLRIYGPNCPGLNNINGKLGMSFSPAYRSDRHPGPIGVATQGGGLGRAFMQSAMARGVGSGLWCSSGNEADLEVSDFIHYMATAPDIRVIYTVVEGVRDGPRFTAAALHAARQGKPIVALKVGKSEYGIRAAMSHTAAITGSAEINTAAFRDLGIIEVDDIDEGVDVATLLARKQPTGRERIAIYTFSGGAAALTADRIGVAGLELAKFTPETSQRLRDALPSYASVDNPVDVTAEVLVNSQLCSETLRTTAEDPETALVLVPIPVEYGRTTESMAMSMVSVQSQVSTLIVPIWISDRSGEGLRLLIEGGLAPLRSVRNTVLALRRFIERGCWADSFDSTWQPICTAAQTQQASTLTEAAAKALLRATGIRVPRSEVAKSAEEAENAFVRLGRVQLALKVISADIAHKTDVGGVRLRIGSPVEARAAFEGIRMDVAKACPTAIVEGVLLEEMLTAPFVEVVVGIHRDPVFGHVCTFGLGGVSVELFKDVSRALLPLTCKSAHRLIEQTRCAALLSGYRGGEKYDVEALVDALVRLSDFVVKHAVHIDELEINPMAVCLAKQGVTALDAVFSYNGTGPSEW